MDINEKGNEYMHKNQDKSIDSAEGTLEFTKLNADPENQQPKKESRKKDKVNRKQKDSCIQRAGTVVSDALGNIFYKLGYAVALRPWTVILCTFLMSAFCSLGMIRFEMKDSSEPIWIPENSSVLRNQRWVESMFPLKNRYNMFIITADNVLSPAVLQQMFTIDQRVKSLQETNNSEEILNFNWTSICIMLSETCWSNNLLELWKFDKKDIESLSTMDDVLKKVWDTTHSPVYSLEFSPQDWLGDIMYDSDGQIIGAKAAKMLYVIKATSTDDMNNKIIAPDLLWEKKFIELGKNISKELPKAAAPIKSLEISAVRSFRDESDNSFNADVVLLMAGVCIIIVYVAVVLGKFNEVEHMVYLALIDVFGIGLASLVSYGIASAIGMFYGPIHPILPFMLLGIGVDDMFVIMESWSNLTDLEKKKDLPTRIAIAMQHAGVSITVTSLTDFVAFAIGASTELPALKSFCVYAALGIFTLYIIQATFFVAWLTIDQRRREASRDACCIWIKYSNFVPNKCSQRIFLPWFLRKFYAPFLVALPIKVLVSSLIICLLGISGYGTYLLKTESDLSWFLPADSYYTKFLHSYEKYFDEGIIADLYTADIDYFQEREKIEQLVAGLSSSEFVKPGSVASWHSSYIEWMKGENAQTYAKWLQIELSQDKYPISEEGFYKLLNAYVARDARQYYTSLKWNDTNPYNPRNLVASKISFKVANLHSAMEEVKALKYFDNLTLSILPEKSFIWAVIFRVWTTNSIIQLELYTNMGLAFTAVFVVTILLVANVLTCIMVCVSVILTLVNVCGFMHFWGLTIDTLTSILLILSIGLAVDYSAHIGHKFMTIRGSRNERAMHTVSVIGPAIIHGAFSTFLAFFLLATSDAYVFITFFKVFFLVCVFGVFNGICVLPVLLSWIGPAPYLNALAIDDSHKNAKELETISRHPTGKELYNQDYNELENRQGNTHIPVRENCNGVEVSSEIKTSTSKILTHRKHFDLGDAGHHDEISILLEELEKKIEKQNSDMQQNSSKMSPEEIIQTCEEYLNKP